MAREYEKPQLLTTTLELGVFGSYGDGGCDDDDHHGGRRGRGRGWHWGWGWD